MVSPAPLNACNITGHAIGPSDVAEAEDAEAGGGVGDDSGILREKADDWLGEEDEDYARYRQKEKHVVKAGGARRIFRRDRAAWPRDSGRREWRRRC